MPHTFGEWFILVCMILGAVTAIAFVALLVLAVVALAGVVF